MGVRDRIRCPRCRVGGYRQGANPYSGKPEFTCSRCDYVWTSGKDGGVYALPGPKPKNGDEDMTTKLSTNDLKVAIGLTATVYATNSAKLHASTALSESKTRHLAMAEARRANLMSDLLADDALCDMLAGRILRVIGDEVVMVRDPIGG